jgi:hypothetical protein
MMKMDMNKVVSLHGGPIGPAGPSEPDETVIAVLEDLLERAKTGEIRSIAYAYLLPEYALGTGWVGADQAGGGIALGFAVSALQHEYYDGIRNG